MRRLLVVLSSLVWVSAVAFAQAAAPDAAAPRRGFDFLIGEWSLHVHVKVSSLAALIHGTPTLVGTWKAEAGADGVDDDLRIMDASGNPVSGSKSHRVFDATGTLWKITSTDTYHGRTSEASGHVQDGEVRIEGRSVDAAGNVVRTRTRYFAITQTSFRMQQDRSTDDGQTWDEAVLTIDAQRAAAKAN